LARGAPADSARVAAAVKSAVALALLLAVPGASCASVWSAARAAAADPATWVPLGGATAFALGDLDEELSDWAREETPLFGSEEGAGDASDAIRDFVRAEAIVLEGLHLIVARDEGNAAWLGPPAAALGSAFVEDTLVEAIKSATDRERPSGVDDRSFPSSHAAGVANSAFAANEIWRRDFGAATWTPAAVFANSTLVGLGAWSRVEAGAHYPSDVLAGVALGHFLGRFAHELIPASVQIEVTPVSIALLIPFGGGG
jgi:hypothetical protein